MRAGGWLLVGLLTLASPAVAGDGLVWEPKDNRVVGVFNAAIDLLNTGQPGPAEARFRKVLKLQEDFGPAWIALGQTLYRLDRPGEAISAYERVVASAPDHAEVLAPLAYALFGAQRFEEAQAAASRAVDALPDAQDAWQILVMSEVRLGTYPRIADRLASLRAVRDTPDLACYAAQVLAEMEQADAAEAAMMVCRDAESEALVWNSETAVAEARGDAEAVSRFAEELGDDASTAFNHAIDAFNQGRFDEVEALASRAIKLQYPTPAPTLLRARARYELGKAAAARKDLREVLGDDGSWVRVTKQGSLTGVLTKSQELELGEWMRGGAAVLVLLHVDEGDLKGASKAVVDARLAFGDFPALEAAEAMVVRAQGQEGKAWSMLAHALRGESSSYVLRIASVLVAESPATATDDAVLAVAERGSPTLVYNLAVGSTNAGLQGRCLSLVDVLVAAPDPKRADLARWVQDLPELLPGVLGLGYDCAVRQPDLAAAERFGALAGWGSVPAWAAVSHADQLYDAGQLDAVIAHLRRCGSADGPQGGWAVALLVSAHLDRGELDQALTWARHRAADPITHYNAGTALGVAGRNAEARELLGAACPELEGDTGKACRTNLQIVTEALSN